jgi:hypothetical protein
MTTKTRDITMNPELHRPTRNAELTGVVAPC